MKIQWGDAPKFGTVFSAFITDETSVFLFVDILSCFELTRFQVTASQQKFG